MATFLEGWSFLRPPYFLFILDFLGTFLALQFSRIKKYDEAILHEDENNISAVC